MSSIISIIQETEGNDYSGKNVGNDVITSMPDDTHIMESEKMETDIVDELRDAEEEEMESDMQEYILRFDDKDVKIQVDQKTAYLLANDHNYAEKYVSSMIHDGQPLVPPDFEYLQENPPQSPNIPVVTIDDDVERDERDDQKSTDTPIVFWTYKNVEALINARLAVEDDFPSPYCVDKKLWHELSAQINYDLNTNLFTPAKCRVKWRTLISSFTKILNAYKSSGKRSSWPFFDVFHEAYGDLSSFQDVAKPTDTAQVHETVKAGDGKASQHWTTSATKNLILIRLNMENLFTQPNSNIDDLWEDVAKAVKPSSVFNNPALACKTKWKNLVATYKKRLDSDLNTVNDAKVWQYFNMFHGVYEGNIPEESDLSTFDDASKPTDTPQDHETVKGCDEKPSQTWTTSATRNLIVNRLKMENLFNKSNSNVDELWEDVAKEVKPSSTFNNPTLACKIKWKNLIATYKKRLDPDSSAMYDSKGWQYFNMFHDVYNGNIPVEQNKSAIWTVTACKLLAKLRLDMEPSFEKTPKGQRAMLWSKIARDICLTCDLNVVGRECEPKWRSILLTYRRNVARRSKQGRSIFSHWPLFEIMHKAFKDKPIVNSTLSRTSLQMNGETSSWSDSNIELLLKLRLGMESTFVRDKYKFPTFWYNIAKKMNFTTNTQSFNWKSCQLKWDKLKMAYDQIAKEMKETRKNRTSWPYYTLFDDVYGDNSDHMDVAPNDMMEASSVSCGETETSPNKSQINILYQYLDKNTPAGNFTDTRTPVSSAKSNIPQAVFHSPTYTAQSSKTVKKNAQTEEERHINFLEESEGTSFNEKINESKRGPCKEKTWLKYMLIDWKKERQQRWEEKKELEREKITAINNLTRAILSFEHKEQHEDREHSLQSQNSTSFEFNKPTIRPNIVLKTSAFKNVAILKKKS